MKKIISILGSLLFITAVKAQTVVKKETTNPGSRQTTSTSSKDPKAPHANPKIEVAKKAIDERAIKDAKVAQQADSKSISIKDPKVEAAKKAEADKAIKKVNILQKGK